MGEGADPLFNAVLVDVHNKFEPEPFRGVVAELDHLFEFPGRIHMHKGEGRLRRVNAFIARCSITALSLPTE